MNLHPLLADHYLQSIIFHYLLAPATAAERLNQDLVAVAATCKALSEVALETNRYHIKEDGAFVGVLDYTAETTSNVGHGSDAESSDVPGLRKKHRTRTEMCGCQYHGQMARGWRSFPGGPTVVRNDASRLPTRGLPVEVLEMIFNRVVSGPSCTHGPSVIDGPGCVWCRAFDAPSRCALTRTSHQFHDVLQQMDDRTLEVRGLSTGGSTSSRRCAMLLVNQERRDRVRSVRLQNISRAAVDAIGPLLPLLTGVRHIRLEGFTITPAVVTFLRKNHGHLRTLTLDRCRYTPGAAKDLQNDPFDPPCLTELVWNDAYLQSTPENPSTRTYFLTLPLRTLTLSSANLPHSHLPVCNTLIELIFTDTWTRNLTKFLSLCSNIEELRVRPVKARRYDPTFGPTFLSKLRVLACEASHVVALLPGRSIQSITTDAVAGLFANELPGLDAVCLTSLSDASGGTSMFKDMVKNCPGLKSLEIRADAGEASIRNMKEWITSTMHLDVATLHQLQVLRVFWHVALCQQVPPVGAIEQLPVGGLHDNEVRAIAWRDHEEGLMLWLKEKGNCPRLHEVWVEPRRAWTFGRSEGAWALEQPEGLWKLNRPECREEWIAVRRIVPSFSAS